MNDQCNVLRDAELLPCSEQELAVLGVAVAVRAWTIKLLGVTHADKIHRNTASMLRQLRHDIAPQIGGRRVAMLENDGVAFAHFGVGHFLAVDGDELLIEFSR